MGLNRSSGAFYLLIVFLGFTAQNFAQQIIKEPASQPDTSIAQTENTGKEKAETEVSYKLTRGNKSFGVEYGISPFNPSNFAGPKEFNVYGRDLNLFSFRIGRVVGTKKNVSYEYMFGVTPLAVFTKNEVVNRNFVSATATPRITPTKRETTYGTGFQPINFKFMSSPKTV